MICRVVRAVRVRGRWAWIPGGGIRSAPVSTPNLRPFDVGIRRHLDMVDADDEDVFAEIRRRKDSF